MSKRQHGVATVLPFSNHRLDDSKIPFSNHRLDDSKIKKWHFFCTQTFFAHKQQLTHTITITLQTADTAHTQPTLKTHRIEKSLAHPYLYTLSKPSRRSLYRNPYTTIRAHLLRQPHLCTHTHTHTHTHPSAPTPNTPPTCPQRNAHPHITPLPLHTHPPTNGLWVGGCGGGGVNTSV